MSALSYISWCYLMLSNHNLISEYLRIIEKFSSLLLSTTQLWETDLFGYWRPDIGRDGERNIDQAFSIASLHTWPQWPEPEQATVRGQEHHSGASYRGGRGQNSWVVFCWSLRLLSGVDQKRNIQDMAGAHAPCQHLMPQHQPQHTVHLSLWSKKLVLEKRFLCAFLVPSSFVFFKLFFQLLIPCSVAW